MPTDATEPKCERLECEGDPACEGRAAGSTPIWPCSHLAPLAMAQVAVACCHPAARRAKADIPELTILIMQAIASTCLT